MLINLTNHPSDKWPDKQLKAAEEYGQIVDYHFPVVPPEASKDEIEQLADDVFNDIKQQYGSELITIHLMGEFSLSFALLHKFQLAGIRCIVSTSQRLVEEKPDGSKVVRFDFVRFREFSSTV